MTPDLAAMRRLAEEASDQMEAIADLWLELQREMRRGGNVHPNDIGDDPATIKRLGNDLSTALRAACDEVERLREALAIEQERRVVTASTMAEHIEDVRTAFVEGMQCAGMTEDGALEMWQHSAALGKLRDIGAFEQAQGGNP